jgi:FolB domain-containing protein
MEKIILEEIRVKTYIGVSDRERARRQTLRVSIEMEPLSGYESKGDLLENTIDYSTVRRDVLCILRENRFHLIETAAERIARYLKEHYSLKSLTVLVKKRPYRDTRYCAYRLSME